MTDYRELANNCPISTDTFYGQEVASLWWVYHNTLADLKEAVPDSHLAVAEFFKQSKLRTLAKDGDINYDLFLSQYDIEIESKQDNKLEKISQDLSSLARQIHPLFLHSPASRRASPDISIDAALKALTNGSSKL